MYIVTLTSWSFRKAIFIIPTEIFIFINVLFTLFSVTRRDVINSIKFRKKASIKKDYTKNGSFLIMTNALLNLHYATILDFFFSFLFSLTKNHVSSLRRIFAL